MVVLYRTLTPSQLLTLVLHAEARGEPIEGQIAVGCSIRNRLDSGRYGSGWDGVILRRAQYSGLWKAGGQANYEATVEFAQHLAAGLPLNPLQAQLRWIAEGIVARILLDNTQEATHYHAQAIVPSWARPPARRTITIGRHVFYADVP